MSLTFHPVSATARCGGQHCGTELPIPDASSLAAIRATLHQHGWDHAASWPGGNLQDLPVHCPAHQPARARR